MIKGKKINAFVQISMTSSRLPRKSLIHLSGKSTVERVINSIEKSNFIDDIILTFTTEKVDDALEEWAIKNNKLYFRGDFKNVIKRYNDALSYFPCDYIVRLTGDCPVVSVKLMDQLIKEHHSNSENDYTRYYSNLLPIGVSTEIMRSQSVKDLMNYNLNLDYSEYMTYYFTNNPHIFLINEITPPKKYNFPNYRLTLDYIEDLYMFEKLFELLDLNFQSDLDLIIKTLNKNPKISEINSHLTLKYKTNKNLIKILNRVTKIK